MQSIIDIDFPLPAFGSPCRLPLTRVLWEHRLAVNRIIDPGSFPMPLAFASISLSMHPTLEGSCDTSIYAVIYQIAPVIPFALLL